MSLFLMCLHNFFIFLSFVFLAFISLITNSRFHISYIKISEALFLIENFVSCFSRINATTLFKWLGDLKPLHLHMIQPDIINFCQDDTNVHEMGTNMPFMAFLIPFSFNVFLSVSCLWGLLCIKSHMTWMPYCLFLNLDPVSQVSEILLFKTKLFQ